MAVQCSQSDTAVLWLHHDHAMPRAMSVQQLCSCPTASVPQSTGQQLCSAGDALPGSTATIPSARAVGRGEDD